MRSPLRTRLRPSLASCAFALLSGSVVFAQTPQPAPPATAPAERPRPPRPPRGTGAPEAPGVPGPAPGVPGAPGAQLPQIPGVQQPGAGAGGPGAPGVPGAHGFPTAPPAAPPPRPEDVAWRLVQARAVNAMIWGMPAVNYDRMLQQMLTKTTAKVNEFIYWSRPVDWKNQTLTPNPDVIYVMAFFNTKDVGPVVIEVPPADAGTLAANIMNVWQMPLEDAGAAGADEGRGGKYLILPPGYAGAKPEGYFVLPSDTYGGYALLRSSFAGRSDAEIAKAVEYAKRLKIYPLSAGPSPGESKFTDAKDVLFDSTIPYDARFFESLDRIVQSEPWLERDRVMIDQLNSLGIEKGKPFTPGARMLKIFDEAAREAHAALEFGYERGLPSFYDGSCWRVAALPDLLESGSAGYTIANKYPVDERGLTYTYGYIGVKRPGKAQYYLMAIADKGGQALDGAKNYRLRVPAGVPVQDYWSVTAYNRETHALIMNMPKASCASNDGALNRNEDGSVDVFFGPTAPAGKQSNWVPTDPSGKFELMFRFYRPLPALFDKSWRLADIEIVP